MIDSRNRRRFALFSATALLAMLSGAAAAQTPSNPTPPPQATAAPRALPGMGAQSGPTGGAAGLPTGKRPDRSGITVSALGEPEGAPTGTLDAASGGLGLDLWEGSSRSELEELMADLPTATPVAPIRVLARRLLLTKASAPLGKAAQAFMTVRIRGLLDSGMIEDAADLAAVADVTDDPGFARVRAEALLFAGRASDVCSDMTTMRLSSSEPFWVELRAYCYAVSGDDAALALTRSVMDAQNIDDSAFDTLLDDVLHHVAKDPGDINDPTALDAFLLGVVGMPVDFDLGTQLGTPGLLLAARDAQNSAQDRLRAAEAVVRTGALTPQNLIAIADAQTFTPSQLAAKHEQIAQLPFLAAQSLLRQAVNHAGADARPALIREALSRAAAKGLLGVAAVLQQGALLKIEPTPDLRDMAGLAGQALMLTGYADAAERWAKVLNPQFAPDRELLTRFAVEQNLIAPGPARQAEAQQALTDLTQASIAHLPDQAFAALVLGLYADLGEAMPPIAQMQAAAIAQMKWPGRRPAPSAMARLDAAVRAPGRNGEALMLVLNAIGPNGPGDLAPDITVHLIHVLTKEGVPDAARNIAVAALLRYRPALSAVPAVPAQPANSAPVR